MSGQGDGGRSAAWVDGPGVRSFAEHPMRRVVLGEPHARPFHAITIPRRILHLAFLSGVNGGDADFTAIRHYCERRGLKAPAAKARHHHVIFDGGSIRWENHTEFSTYTFELEMAGEDAPFMPPRPILDYIHAGLEQPGPLIVAIDLHLLPAATVGDVGAVFDASGFAFSEVDDGSAIAATDLRVSADGWTRILVCDQGLAPARAGALTIRLLEIETYRTISLLGLPEARALGPRVRAMEVALTDITGEIRASDGFAASERLLDRLSALSAELAAESAAHSYRFSASRAYDEIVHQRLKAIREMPVRGHDGWTGFLTRRHAPAMRTCLNIEKRLADLADQVARAAALLRTRVDIELERQNHDLLKSMNERTRLQLRLQHTVEGLSVAAVSYYIVALIADLARGAESLGLPVPSDLVAGLALPVVVVVVALVVGRIRRSGSHPD